MPTEQPSSAPDGTPHARDADTAASVLHDDALDTGPGGGGLGGASAADPLAGSGRTPSGTAPNAPIDVPTPHPGNDREAEADARAEASGTAAAGLQSGQR